MSSHQQPYCRQREQQGHHHIQSKHEAAIGAHADSPKTPTTASILPSRLCDEKSSSAIPHQNAWTSIYFTREYRNQHTARRRGRRHSQESHKEGQRTLQGVETDLAVGDGIELFEESSLGRACGTRRSQRDTNTFHWTKRHRGAVREARSLGLRFDGSFTGEVVRRIVAARLAWRKLRREEVGSSGPRGH